MRYRYQSREHLYEIAIERKDASYSVALEGKAYTLEVLDQQPGQIMLRIAGSGIDLVTGKNITLYWANDGDRKWVSVNGCTYLLEKPARPDRSPAGEPGEGQAVRAPMPAQVRAVQIVEGEVVEKGQTLILLEAMKMEIHIKAPGSGKVTHLTAVPGQAVQKDQVLAEIGG